MEKKHTVYEAEDISLVMGLHLLYGLGRKLTHLTTIGLDSQAINKALDNQYPNTSLSLFMMVLKNCMLNKMVSSTKITALQLSKQITVGNVTKMSLTFRFIGYPATLTLP